MKNNIFHTEFIQSSKKHILMLSIHGVHEWNVVPGLKDTGGQNVFVNQFSAALVKAGYKITIVNRGGYTHPRSGRVQSGIHYKDSNQRILYLVDTLDQFVRKEDMGKQIPELVQALSNFLKEEGFSINLIISHYWDAAALGTSLKEDLDINATHIWVPHSLGEVKKRNISDNEWEQLKILDRIEFEEKIFQKIDFLAATSSIIRESSINDYHFSGKFLWLPPCVDQERYYPRHIEKTDPIWALLSSHSNLPIEKIQNRNIITEISRTDRTKQKNILIKAFANILINHPDSFLILTIDDTNAELAEELRTLINDCGIKESTAAVGSVWQELPKIYAITDIYCTPSIMEGFGMSVQEAAVTNVPVISSDLVPFVTEYLAGSNRQMVTLESGSQIEVGEGAVIVPPGDIAAFSFALDMLLSDEKFRKEMGEKAYEITSSNFVWDQVTQDFINGINTK